MRTVNQTIGERFRALLGPAGYTEDQEEIAPWVRDWRGIFQGKAAALLSPRTPDEVAAIVKIAAEASIPLVPQGGNTSMVGGATPSSDGSAMIVSLRRMNQIRAINTQSNIVVAEAGVILQTLHDAVAEQGRRFPLSLSAKGSATIGGLVSTNAGGVQVLRFGSMRALTLGVEAVLPDGSIHHGLSPLKKDTRGYDLTQLLVGAEGTLAIITAAALRLVPAIADRAVAWVGVDRPQTALKLLRFLESRSERAIESFEVLPEETLRLVLRHIDGTRAPLSGVHGWHVLVEAVADENARESLQSWLEQAAAEGLIEDAVMASSEAQAAALWHLRHLISEAERADGPAMQHDISVPVDAMPDFIESTVVAIEAAFPGTRARGFGHLGDGNVHFHVRAPDGVDGPRWREGQGKAISERVYDLVTAAHGSISAEHGIGQMKRDQLARLGGAARCGALRAIKQALDPQGIMNPGKLVPLAIDASPA